MAGAFQLVDDAGRHRAAGLKRSGAVLTTMSSGTSPWPNFSVSSAVAREDWAVGSWKHPSAKMLGHRHTEDPDSQRQKRDDEKDAARRGDGECGDAAQHRRQAAFPALWIRLAA